MEEYINENDFYTNGEAEHYLYCRYQFNVQTNEEDARNYTPDFDMFALITNSNPMYIRLCKKRKSTLKPCVWGGGLLSGY